MTMVSWPETARGQLRVPAVCAVTGRPAATSVRFVSRSQWARFAPGIASLVLYVVSPRMDIPLAAAPAQRVRIGRVTSWAGAVFFAVGEVVGFTVQQHDERLGAGIRLVGFAGLVMLVVGSIVARRVLRVRADGGWLFLGNAHPAFADALIRLNPPDMVQVPGGWPQTWGYQIPQQSYGPPPGPLPGTIR